MLKFENCQGNDLSSVNASRVNASRPTKLENAKTWE